MVTIRAVVPRREETQVTGSLTKREKGSQFYCCLFIAMIGVTIATSPFVADLPTRSIYDKASD